MMTAYNVCLAVDVNRVHGSKEHPSSSGRFFRLKPNLLRDDLDVDWTMGFIAIITNNVAGVDMSRLLIWRHWPLWGEFTGGRWIPPCTKGH